MAFSTKEQEIMKWGIDNGKTPQEIKQAVTNFRIYGTPRGLQQEAQQGFLQETKEDFQQSFQGSVEAVKRGVETRQEARQQVADSEISPFAATVKTIGGGLRAGAEVVGQGFLGVGKALLPQEAEDAIGGAVKGVAGSIAESKPVQELINRYEVLSPEKKALVDGTLGIAEGFTAMFGVKPAIEAVKGGITPAISQIRATTGSLFRRATDSIDDVVAQADDALRSVGKTAETAPTRVQVDLDSVNKQLDKLIEQGKTAEARALAEQTASGLSLKEKWAGIRPDIKQRIQGKSELMQEYFDVAHARNVNDTLPTIYEYGGNFARQATDKMEELLNKTGVDIGAVRKRLGSNVAPGKAVSEIETSFTRELQRLNLRIGVTKTGQPIIERIPNTVSRLEAAGDLRVINDLYNEWLIVKNNPTLTNLIDLRNNFDGTINFGKAQREVSGAVDPLSRKLRTVVRDTANEIVGPDSANDLKKYSEFMDAYSDIKSYTDRRAGGEYLLRLVLSGRGGEARQIVQTIKEHTGIDLLDHATMMQIATELVGNDAQKNLFRQEISKAGLDVSRLLRGDPTGAAATLYEKAMDRIINPEKTFLEAAQ